LVFQNHLFEGVCVDALTFIVTKHHLLWLRLQSSDLIALLPIGTLAVVALLLCPKLLNAAAVDLEFVMTEATSLVLSRVFVVRDGGVEVEHVLIRRLQFTE